MHLATQPLKAQKTLHAPSALTLQHPAFCLYMFHMILTVYNDYFPK
jgi:hypothetical protein